MDQYKPGDIIEHRLMPDYRMPVEDTRPCGTDANRPEEHLAYQVTDPDGNTDWLCAYDAQRPGENLPVGSVVMADEKLAEGWGVIRPGDRKAHYYRDTMALCRRVGFYAGPLWADTGPGPDDHKECRKVLDAEKSRAAKAAGR